MVKQFLILAAFVGISSYSGTTAQGQYGGLQVQVGGYGTGLRVGGLGSGNGFYNSYGNGYGYGYGNAYRSYGNYRQPAAVYFNGDNYGDYRYNSYPTMTYGLAVPRYYSTPARRYLSRRFR